MMRLDDRRGGRESSRSRSKTGTATASREGAASRSSIVLKPSGVEGEGRTLPEPMPTSVQNPIVVVEAIEGCDGSDPSRPVRRRASVERITKRHGEGRLAGGGWPRDAEDVPPLSACEIHGKRGKHSCDIRLDSILQLSLPHMETNGGYGVPARVLQSSRICRGKCTTLHQSAYQGQRRIAVQVQWRADGYGQWNGNDVVTSIIRSDCCRLERQLAGRDSHPLWDGAFPRRIVKRLDTALDRVDNRHSAYYGLP